MTHLYYKTERTSETGRKIEKLKEKAKVIEDSIDKFLLDVGADQNEWIQKPHAIFNTGIIAVKFKEEPDMKKWKKMKGYIGFYCPRASSKELNERFKNLGVVRRQELQECINFSNQFKGVGYDGDENYFYFELKSEWNHSMPQDCQEITGSDHGNRIN